MKTIDDIQRELKSLASELEQLKESKNDSVPDIDFVKISAHGVRFPIKNHPKCPYKLDIIKTIVNPCPQCKMSAYRTYKRFLKNIEKEESK